MDNASSGKGTPPRKLTKSEAGRKGGQTTRDRHGRDHYVRAGKLGFAALAKARGYFGGSRLGALRWLIRTGQIRMGADELRRYAEAEAWAEGYIEAHGIDPEPEGKADGR